MNSRKANQTQCCWLHHHQPFPPQRAGVIINTGSGSTSPLPSQPFPAWRGNRTDNFDRTFAPHPQPLVFFPPLAAVQPGRVICFPWH